MITSMAGFLEKLRSADEGTKTRWIIIITSIIMVIVVYIWLAYFNNLFTTASVPAETEPNNQGKSATTNPRTSLQQRAGALYYIFIDKIRALGTMLKTPREYIVTPNQK